MVVFVKENKKGTAVIAVGGFYPPSYVDKKKKFEEKKMIEKNEEKEKSGAGIRTSQWLWIVDLFGDYNHFPVGLTRFLKQFIRPVIFTYGVVWRLKRKEILL